jgi:hypothetical protein
MLTIDRFRKKLPIGAKSALIAGPRRPGLMMSVSTIREAIKATPFKPFRVMITDQRSYNIEHPEYVAIGPQNRTLVVFHDDGGASFIDMLMITRIDVGVSEEGVAD